MKDAQDLWWEASFQIVTNTFIVSIFFSIYLLQVWEDPAAALDSFVVAYTCWFAVGGRDAKENDNYHRS